MVELWAALTGPTAGISGEGPRRRSQTIATVLLPLIGTLTVSIPFLPVVPQGCALVSLVIAVGAYGLGRLGHDRAAGLLTVLSCLILPWWGLYTPEPDTLPFAEIMWLMLALMLGGLSLPRRWLVAINTLVICGTGLVMRHGAIPPQPILALLGFLALVSMLSFLSVSIIERGEQQLVERAEQVQQINDRLLQTRAQLLHAGKMVALGELSAAVAHEINSPLTVVMLHSAMLRDAADDDQREQLDDILEAARRCQSITRGLLDFGRSDSSGRRRVDLAEVATATLSLVRHHLFLQGAAVEAALSEEMHVEADPDQLGQVVLNLLTNAGHALQEGGTIQLRGGRSGEEVWLSVIDDGCGIPEESRGRIFEPFFTTRGAGEGTGLGLALSDSIIREHGGRIELESTVGRGTAFTVRLPAAAG